ncbi:N-acetyltransferase [Rhodophyticola porphyridii]|uniref:N-acetyltransferase n=1 Tax=Rhodophyticola porphyridii TaxID=1852017 RepID=A0A3L9Y677_9RHOB|nr:N-acetyltransferase [Rhodophyticola porphyridii]
MTVHIPTLETARLTLRALRLGDFEAYAATFASPRSRFMGTLTRREAWNSFASEAVDWLFRGHGIWAIDLKGGPHIVLTGIGQPDHFPEPEIGWILHDGHEGHGYATEAAETARDWARNRVTSLVSYIDLANHRSISVARRLGATADPRAALPRGETADETVVYRHWGKTATRRKVAIA